MQLPRGTFRALKRGCNMHTLINELKDSAFSGYCRIAPESGPITLVFDRGMIRLAEYKTIDGDAALERVFQSGPVTIDAVLHDLSPAQINLAVEFSPSSVVKSERRIVSSDRKEPQSYGNDVITTAKKEGHLDHEISLIDKTALNTTFEKPAIRSENSPVQTFGDGSLLSRELDALDSMDIEGMAAKFRTNCRIMMERLGLEHLVDHNTEKMNHD